jgi:hypothetical protein
VPRAAGRYGPDLFDDDVKAFFSPHTEGKSAIFLTAPGEEHQMKKE